MAPPDFSDHTRFPGFRDLPLAQSLTSSSSSPTHYLIGQVKENMTITNPTLIITDLQGVDCAVTFASSTFDLSPFRKGKTCLVVPGAARTAPADEGKKGFVRIEEGQEGEVRCLPGKIEVVGRLKGEGEGRCCAEGCEKEGGPRCTGCKMVKYCGKDCQVKAWTDGHNRECKVFKVVQEIWGE